MHMVIYRERERVTNRTVSAVEKQGKRDYSRRRDEIRNCGAKNGFRRRMIGKVADFQSLILCVTRRQDDGLLLDASIEIKPAECWCQ